MRKRAIVLILDSLGVGYMEDTKETRPEDIGANTFYHIIDSVPHIAIPQLERLGLNRIVQHPRLGSEVGMASYGKLNLKHFGADSYAGHNEIMGNDPKKPFTAPFATVINEVKQALEHSGYQVELPDPDLPYLVVDGLTVIADNIETDYGQIYNVTAPLDHIPFDQVLQIGEVVRNHVKVNRVIALGGENVSPQKIRNAVERRDDGLIGVNSPKSGVYEQGYQARHLGYGVNPETQAGRLLIRAGKAVTLIGKMQDVISCEGAKKIPAVDTDEVMRSVVANMDEMAQGMIAATVQETDLAGHAQDANRYAEKIMCVDRYLQVIIDKMTDEDLLIISADHGNDPTIGHSQHTREKTFLLAYGKTLAPINLGERDTLSDIAATVTDFFDTGCPANGTSFYPALTRHSLRGHNEEESRVFKHHC